MRFSVDGRILCHNLMHSGEREGTGSAQHLHPASEQAAAPSRQFGPVNAGRVF